VTDGRIRRVLLCREMVEYGDEVRESSGRIFEKGRCGMSFAGDGYDLVIFNN